MEVDLRYPQLPEVVPISDRAQPEPNAYRHVIGATRVKIAALPISNPKITQSSYTHVCVIRSKPANEAALGTASLICLPCREVSLRQALRLSLYTVPVCQGEQRYSPADVVEAVPKPVMGNPDKDRICTSHVERQNLSIRMGMRRMTRLTNAFSKKWDNLWAAYCLWFAFYNFCRVHKALRVTPAMEAGITTRVWELREVMAAA